jgi:hypothetical protein
MEQGDVHGEMPSQRFSNAAVMMKFTVHLQSWCIISRCLWSNDGLWSLSAVGISHVSF